MEQIEGVLAEIIYQNEVNSYVVGVLETEYEQVTVVGYLPFISKGDSMFFPDYEGIEIKCKQRYSRYDINLFCLSFDGPELFESNYILQKYGKRRTILSLKKELFINFNINKSN